ncbi:DNA polymerase Y family protein [Asticcacaulis sp. AND118]|uniref:DNA polymerase Y family protein n=1 Tax=Asticcacaulis sp. AND118 TaxID=2840468 RepID=UPI00210699FD
MVLKGTDGRRRVVTAANRAALRGGVRIGMPLTQAQVLIEGLIAHDAEPERDAEALDVLAQWGLRTFSPLVAPDAPDGLIIDVTGADHLHGGEAELLRHMVQKLAEKQITARAAIADTRGAAHALARFVARPIHLCPCGQTTAALSPLPVAALRVTPSHLQDLNQLGFETIGDLLHQPRAPLAQRFGPDLVRRLDQALGHTAEPIEPVHLSDVIAVERGFFEPIGAPETLSRYTAKLTADLCERLETKGLGARQVDLYFTRVDNRIEAIRVGMARPVRDPTRLTRLLCDKLETVEPGFGIERMRLVATEAEPLAPVQVSHTEENTIDLAALIDVLSNRIGDGQLYRVMPVHSDVPERATRRCDPLDAVTSNGAGHWPQHWPRPMRLFPKPEAIRTLAQLPDHPPTHIIWRGTRYHVIAADGPERIFGEWWLRDGEIAAVRDYFRVEIETGERLWIYRSGDGEDAETGDQNWHLHGMFA